MAIKITDDCIHCKACEQVSNNAIYAPEELWRFRPIPICRIRRKEMMEAFLTNIFIVTDKCTECVGFHEEPQCAAVCPVDCCVPDEENVETKEELSCKKDKLHA